jgi:hypothetical protein
MSKQNTSTNYLGGVIPRGSLAQKLKQVTRSKEDLMHTDHSHSHSCFTFGRSRVQISAQRPASFLNPSRRVPWYYLKIRPQVLPSAWFPIHHSLITLSFNAYWKSVVKEIHSYCREWNQEAEVGFIGQGAGVCKGQHWLCVSHQQGLSMFKQL